jgi:hypothetical protein
MRPIEAVPALLVLALAAAILVGTAGLKLWDGPTPGARFFPLIIAIAGSAVALALLWAQWRGFEQVDVHVPGASGGMRVALTLAALVVLVAGTPVVGLVQMLAAFVAVMLVGVLRQPVPASLGAAVLVAGFVHIVFVRWLSVPLPMPLGL